MNWNNLFSCLLIYSFICCKSNNKKPLIIEKDKLKNEQTILDQEKGLMSNKNNI